MSTDSPSTTDRLAKARRHSEMAKESRMWPTSFYTELAQEHEFLLSLVDSLQERLDTAEGRLRELATLQDRIPDTDNGDWGLGYDQGYNAAYGEVRAIATEGLDQGSGVSQ